MNNIAISVSLLGKYFAVQQNRPNIFRRVLGDGGVSSTTSEGWALRNVSFEIKRGEAVAIIGTNGSGKSTLLEILTGTVRQSEGSVNVNGRVSALLELGSGFDPEYTGRDNVLMNGLLLGLTKSDILSRFSRIEEFADIGAAIDRPVKTYSSGMLMRLAFAVQVLCEPEILIIDEALSVGDFFFQQKCLGFIRELNEKGVTLVFVSHDMSVVRDLCSKALLLDLGRQQYFGDSKSAIQMFLSPQDKSSPLDDCPQYGLMATDLAWVTEAALWFRKTASDINMRLFAVHITDLNGSPIDSVRVGETIKLKIFYLGVRESNGHISFVLKNKYDQVVTTNGTYFLDMPPCNVNDGECNSIVFEIDLLLEPGLYSLSVAYAIPSQINCGDILDETGWIGPIEVLWNHVGERAKFLGMFGLPCRGRYGYDLTNKHSIISADLVIERSILNTQSQTGDGGITILAAYVTDKYLNPSLSVEIGEELNFYILARADRFIGKPYFGIVIYDAKGELVFTGTTLQIRGYSNSLSNGESILIGFKVRMTVQSGEYWFRLSCAEPCVPYHPNKGVTLHAYGPIGPLIVTFDYESQRAPFYGVAQLPMEML